jgi:acetolactate synthase regulatory subunit
MAEAYGAVGMRVKCIEEVDEALQKALQVTDGPVIIDFWVDRNTNVYPMVLPEKRSTICWGVKWMAKHTLSVTVENRPGVLTKVATLFRRRGYNIDSLTVGRTESPDISRMTIVVEGDDRIIEQVNKQLHKLVEVIKIIDITQEKAVERELSMFRSERTIPFAQKLSRLLIFSGPELWISARIR